MYFGTGWVILHLVKVGVLGGAVRDGQRLRLEGTKRHRIPEL